MKTTIQVLLINVVILILSGVVIAQPGLPNPPAQAPIDGGLGILAAAGGAYAFKKLRERNSCKEDMEE